MTLHWLFILSLCLSLCLTQACNYTHPCPNGGECIDEMCDCSNTAYFGDRCNINNPPHIVERQWFTELHFTLPTAESEETMEGMESMSDDSMMDSMSEDGGMRRRLLQDEEFQQNPAYVVSSIRSNVFLFDTDGLFALNFRDFITNDEDDMDVNPMRRGSTTVKLVSELKTLSFHPDWMSNCDQNELSWQAGDPILWGVTMGAACVSEWVFAVEPGRRGWEKLVFNVSDAAHMKPADHVQLNVWIFVSPVKVFPESSIGSTSYRFTVSQNTLQTVNNTIQLEDDDSGTLYVLMLKHFDRGHGIDVLSSLSSSIANDTDRNHWELFALPRVSESDAQFDLSLQLTLNGHGGVDASNATDVFVFDELAVALDLAQFLDNTTTEDLKSPVVLDLLADFYDHCTMNMMLSEWEQLSCAPLHLEVTFQVDCEASKVVNVWNDGDDLCLACPTGALCTPDGSVMPTNQPGFIESDISAFVYLECTPHSACIAGNQCSAGYVGPVCGLCDEAYFRSKEGACSLCPDYGALVIVIGLGVVLLVGGLFCFLATKGKFLFEIVGVVTLFFQTLVEFSFIDLNWTPSIKNMFNSLSVFTLDVNLLASECYVQPSGGKPGTYQFKFLLFMNFPLVMSMLLFSIPACVWLKNALSRGCSGIASFRDVATENTISMANVMIIAFLYLPLVGESLKFFDCTEIADGRFSLDKQPELYCLDNWWFELLPLAAFYLVLYTIGVPVFFMRKLRARPALQSDIDALDEKEPSQWQKDIAWLKAYFHNGKDSSYVFQPSDKVAYLDAVKIWEARYSSLCLQYRPQYYYWELFILARKVAITAMKILFRSHPNFQATIIMMVLVLFLILQRDYRPYADKTVNRLDEASMTACILVLMLGILMSNENLNPVVRETLGVVAIVVVMACVTYVILLIHRFIRLNLQKNRDAAKMGQTQRKSLRFVEDEIKRVMMLDEAAVASLEADNNSTDTEESKNSMKEPHETQDATKASHLLHRAIQKVLNRTSPNDIGLEKKLRMVLTQQRSNLEKQGLLDNPNVDYNWPSDDEADLPGFVLPG